MTINALGLNNLHHRIASIPPLELKGMVLLWERCPADGFFPVGIPRTTMVETITEITAYTERARRMREALTKLAPIPLLSQPILEYGL
jgi:hypothetical protein